MRRLVSFFLHDREFAAPIEQVRETIELRPITPVFRTPAAVAGVTNLRGEILAVLDVSVMLGLPPNRRDPSARIVIVEPDERCAGLLVDSLGIIRDVDPAQIGPVPPTVSADVAAMLEGVLSLSQHPVGVLAPGRLLGAPEISPFARERADAPEEK